MAVGFIVGFIMAFPISGLIGWSLRAAMENAMKEVSDSECESD